MEGFNKIFCGQDAKNTGICDCFFDPKLMIGAILVPKNRVFTLEELKDENIQATLEDLVAETRKLRIYPVQGFVAITDASAEPTEQTFGYGTVEPVKDGNYNWTFGFRNGGINLSNALRTFNGLTSKYAVIFIESQNHLLGTVKKDINGANGLAGIPLEVLYTYPWKANDGTNLTSYRIRFNFLPQYINEGIAFKKVSSTSYMLAELAGLETVQLELIEAVDATNLVIGASSDCGSTDMYEEFADEIANEEAWVAYDGDGATIAIVSVTKNDVQGGWNVEFASAPSIVTWAAPSVLAVAPVNVSGYEADDLVIASGS